MKRPFLPYYVSRALLSAVFSILVFGITWKALVLGLVLFGLFLLYLHSGWFAVDAGNPLFPLRRDERAREAQRKALIAALIVGAGVFLGLSFLPLGATATSAAVPLAITLAVLVYFGSQFGLLAGR